MQPLDVASMAAATSPGIVGDLTFKPIESAVY